MNQECNTQTGENIVWAKMSDGTVLNYPPDYWYGRVNSKADYRVTVTDGENFGKGYVTGDMLEIDVFIGDLKPGDLILDVDRNGGVIRRLRSLDARKGKDRGEVLAAVEFPPGFELPSDDTWSVQGRIVTLVRDLDYRTEDRNAGN